MTEPTSHAPTFDLVDAFKHKSDQLRSQMRSAHAVTTHGPTIGDSSEESWRTMLAAFLPRRYAVSKAFVVDSRGCSSEQLDLNLCGQSSIRIEVRRRSGAGPFTVSVTRP